MLVLNRKAGETVHIGDRIVVKVAKICGNRVKIGIDAPHEVPIVRGELEAWSAPARSWSEATDADDRLDMLASAAE